MWPQAWSAKPGKNLPAPVRRFFKTKIRPTFTSQNIQGVFSRKQRIFCENWPRRRLTFSEKISRPKSEIQNHAYLCRPFKNDGIVAEWLGTGLQNLLQRFESARYLQTISTKGVRPNRGAHAFVFPATVQKRTRPAQNRTGFSPRFFHNLLTIKQKARRHELGAFSCTGP